LPDDRVYPKEGKTVTGPTKQPRYFVVFFEIDYPSIGAAMADAPEAIAAHKQRAQAWHEQGRLVMAGAFQDAPDGRLNTMGVLTTHEAAVAFAEGDPFVLNGKAIRWYVREWNNMLS
jgi:uncharacterized protein YciI